MIELQGITKSFGTLQVLKGIDLMIEKGEVVSIVGPSGAGKTTLLQIMGTLDKADTGTILLNGTEVSCLKEKELSAFRNRQIGFVFQFHQLLPEFTALENVMMPALIAVKYLRGFNGVMGYIFIALFTSPFAKAYQWKDIPRLWKAYCDGIHEKLGIMS